MVAGKGGVPVTVMSAVSGATPTTPVPSPGGSVSKRVGTDDPSEPKHRSPSKTPNGTDNVVSSTPSLMMTVVPSSTSSQETLTSPDGKTAENATGPRLANSRVSGWSFGDVPRSCNRVAWVPSVHKVGKARAGNAHSAAVISPATKLTRSF